MRGGIILGILCGCFLFWQNIEAAGGFSDKDQDQVVVTPPALLEVSNNFTNYKRPYINGSVLDEVVKIKIVIDKILIDEFEVNGNSFSYESKWNLKLGPHFVYAVGFDELGQASPISNIIYFNVKKIDPHQPQISATKIETASTTNRSTKNQETKEVLGEKIQQEQLKKIDLQEKFMIKKELLLFFSIIAILAVWFFRKN